MLAPGTAQSTGYLLYPCSPRASVHDVPRRADPRGAVGPIRAAQGAGGVPGRHGIGYVLFAIGVLTKNLPLLFASRILDGITGGNIAIANAAIADVTGRKTAPSRSV